MNSINLIEIISSFTGREKILAGIGFIILVEIVYFILIRTSERKRDFNLFTFTVSNKFMSIFIAMAGLALISVLLLILPAILWAVGIAGTVFLYFGINYILTKKFGKVESEKEFKARTGAKEKALAKMKFKIGERCRISRKAELPSDFSKDIGDIVKIERITPDASLGPYEVEGVEGHWYEFEFTKLRKRR